MKKQERNIQVFYSRQCTWKILAETFVDSVDYAIKKIVLEWPS